MTKHASDLKFCGCRSCRAGLHRVKGGHVYATRARRSARRAVKELCKMACRAYDDVEIPDRVSVPYTD